MRVEEKSLVSKVAGAVVFALLAAGTIGVLGSLSPSTTEAEPDPGAGIQLQTSAQPSVSPTPRVPKGMVLLETFWETDGPKVPKGNAGHPQAWVYAKVNKDVLSNGYVFPGWKKLVPYEGGPILLGVQHSVRGLSSRCEIHFPDGTRPPIIVDGHLPGKPIRSDVACHLPG